MKEFVIEEYTINSDNSIDIEYYFYSEFKQIHFTEEQVEKVIISDNQTESFNEFLNDYFTQEDCIKLLKYYIRDYAQKKQKIQ